MKRTAQQIDWDQAVPLVSGVDAAKMNRACDEFLRRRGLYVEPPMVRVKRERMEKEMKFKKSLIRRKAGKK